MKPVLVQILSLIALFAFFLPLVVVLAKKLTKDRFFMSFAIYWTLAGVAELFDRLPYFSRELKSVVNVVYNMLDTPMVLGIMFFTTTSVAMKRYASLAMIFYLSLEIMGVVYKGLSYDALKYPLGVGLLLVIVALAWEVIEYMKKVEHSSRETARLLICAAVLFEYASFIVIYIFDYLMPERNQLDRTDIYLVYYLSALIGTFIALTGFVTYKKYVRREPIRNEVKIDII